MNSINKFKPLAVSIHRDLIKAGIKCHITHYSRFNNTVYLGFRDLKSRLWALRISDHKGNSECRYELRMDISKSFKTDKQFIYSFNDLQGLLMRLKKENGGYHVT